MSTKTISLDKDSIEELPESKPVVYKITNSKGTNIYTGVAKRGRVQDRIKVHLKGSDKIPGGVKVQVIQKDSIDEAEKSESLIIARSKPRHTKKGK